MKKVEFKDSVSVEKLVEFYELDESEFSGSGVYKIKLGSRGLVEYVVKMSEDNSFFVRSVEEIMEEIDSGMLEVMGSKYGREKVEEFVISEFVDWNEEWVGIMYVEGWDEEDVNEYYFVK